MRRGRESFLPIRADFLHKTQWHWSLFHCQCRNRNQKRQKHTAWLCVFAFLPCKGLLLSLSGTSSHFWNLVSNFSEMEETAKCRTPKGSVQALKRTLPGTENPPESPSEKIFLKNFKNISENFAKTTPSIRDRSERGRKPASRCMRGGEQLLELTPSQKKTVRHQFDSFCRKVLREEARDYERHIAWRSDHELHRSDRAL